MEAQRYAVVEIATGKVVNVIMWDGVSEWSPPEGTTAHRSDTASVGDDW